VEDLRSRRDIATAVQRRGGSPLEALRAAAEHPYPWEGSGALPGAERPGPRFPLGGPFDPTTQTAVEWLGDLPEPLPRPHARADFAGWCASARDIQSSQWWSVPLSPDTLVTARAHRGSSLLLLAAEDDLGRTQAVVHDVVAPPGLRVFEVDGAEDWRRLVERAPLDVTVSRRSTWGTATGSGPLLLPDWSALADEFDVVHLTVDGYLDAAGVFIPVLGGRTLIAGFDPDAALWLAPRPEVSGSALVHRVDAHWPVDGPGHQQQAQRGG
jgi:hypothetical protein